MWPQHLTPPTEEQLSFRSLLQDIGKNWGREVISSTSSFLSELYLKIKNYLNSYNPHDGPNDNPDVELPLTAGEYIYVYGDMDDDGFYEGKSLEKMCAYIMYLQLAYN